MGAGLMGHTYDPWGKSWGVPGHNAWGSSWGDTPYRVVTITGQKDSPAALSGQKSSPATLAGKKDSPATLTGE